MVYQAIMAVQLASGEIKRLIYIGSDTEDNVWKLAENDNNIKIPGTILACVSDTQKMENQFFLVQDGPNN